MIRVLFGMLCCALFVEASEYIFSYRVAVKNGILLSEKYYFSPAMVSAKMLDKVQSSYQSCEIAHDAKTEKEFIKAYQNEILACFFSWGVRLEDRSEVRNLQGRSITFLSIPPSRIKIEYASGIATIYAFIQNKKRAI